MRDPDTQPVTLSPVQPHVITYPRPWYRQVRFVVPISIVAGLLLGLAITAGSSAAPASSASTPTVTRTVTTPGPTKTEKVAVTRTETPAAVKRVLQAWTDSGPQPDKQAEAMRRVMDEWPTLAKALEKATGVKVPAQIQRTEAPASPTEAPPPVSDVYYPNCAAARAAGAAPLFVGEPGYRPGLDRDSDGVACE